MYSRHSGETLPPATGGLHAVTRHMISQLDTRHPYSQKNTYFLYLHVFSGIGIYCWFCFDLLRLSFALCVVDLVKMVTLFLGSHMAWVRSH